MKLFAAVLWLLISVLAALPAHAQSAARQRIIESRPMPEMLETTEQRAAREREELKRREQEIRAREQQLQEATARLAEEKAQAEEREQQQRAAADQRAAEAAYAEALAAAEAENTGLARLWNLIVSFKIYVLIAMLVLAGLVFFWRDERREAKP